MTPPILDTSALIEDERTIVRKNVTRTAQVTITIIMVSKNAVMPDDISLPKALWNILYTVSAGLFTVTPKLFFASYCK